MLTIRNAEAERLAHELASQRGQPVDDIVLEALQAEQRRSVGAPPRKLRGQDLLNAVRPIQDRVASRPVLDHRSADEIVGYNEHGTFD